MLVSMNWIRDFVDLSGLDIEKLINRFTLQTAEVEDITYKGKEINQVIAGKIIQIDKHPESDKLCLIKVNTGNRIYECVCGAPDIYEGMIVPFACMGGSIEGMEIKETMIAGYVSEGMCLSEAELMISGDNSRLMVLDDDVPLGIDIKDIYALEDIVFEIDNKSLTNRPDLWGHYGIAREFAALAGRSLRKLDTIDASIYGHLPPVDIKVENKEDVYRYTGIKVKHISKKVSPINMKIRLTYCGMRPIHLLADLTNYIMLEMGQPMHAFDLRRVDCIEVKNFDEEMDFVTLDKVIRKINKSTLMISSKNKPIAIAGIMGGLDTEIEEDTDSLLLESANFDGISVRKSGARLSLRTDASMRYEKALDPEMTSIAIERYLKLLYDIDNDILVSSCMTDCYVKRYDKIHISFEKSYVDRYTGIDIPLSQIVSTLKSLGFKVEKCEDDTQKLSVEVPSFRATKDVTIPADLVEEITRIYGYDNFDISSTYSRLYPAVISDEKRMEYTIKDLLVGKFNLHETASYIWTDIRYMKELGIKAEQNVGLLNYLTDGLNDIKGDSIALKPGVLRNSMIPSLLSVLYDNKAFSKEYGIFEIGKVIEGLKDDGMCNERKKLAIVLYDKNHSEKSTFYRLKDMICAIGLLVKNKMPYFRNAKIKYEWQNSVNMAEILIDDMANDTKASQCIAIGYLCTLHPMNKDRIDKNASIVVAEIDMGLLGDIEGNLLEYKEVSRYPSIEVDLCFVMKDGITFDEIRKVWTNLEFSYLHMAKVIDIYDEKVKSITVRFEFLSKERTLTHEEVKPFIEKLVDGLKEIGVSIKE